MKGQLLLILFMYLMIGCKINKTNSESFKGSISTSGYTPDSLPSPYATPSSKNFSKVIGWEKGNKPLAPKGFTVTKFADGLDHPRWIYVADNGDIFIAESNTVLKGIKKIAAKLSRKIKTQHYGESANRITIFRDVNKDGVPEERFTFLENLNQPFGMLIIGNYFYVANTDALKRYPYKEGITHIKDTGTTILTLPAGKYNQHWTRNIITNASHDKIYIAVGTSSNIGEHGLENEKGRAAIHEVNNGHRKDPRLKDQQTADTIKTAIAPDVLLGSHTASLGLAFYEKKMFPSKYYHGAFIAQHGSWNRSALSGYKVIFVPFDNGRPSGNPEDFLTGFIAAYNK
jgi:glucose/arabinose dehydrogenase